LAIRSFKQRWLEVFYYDDVKTGVKPQISDSVFRKLKLIDYATCLEDLRSPPGNKLHRLSGKRNGQWAVAVNGPWRLCFFFEKGEASEVELVQYH